MMKVIGYTFVISVFIVGSQTNAAEIYKNDDLSVKFGGAVRARIDIDPDRDVRKLNFDTLILNSDINFKNYGFEFEYRVLGGAYPYAYTDNLGDISFLKKGFFKYKKEDLSIQLGLNQVPIGSKPYFSNSVIETLGYVLGIEDLYKVGIKAEGKNFSVGFYPQDVWNGEGTSNGDSYSNIITKADSYLENGTNFEEKNAFVLKYHRNTSKNLNDDLGISLFYSDLDNKDSGENGNRLITGIDYSLTKGNQNFVINAFYNKIDNGLKYTTLGAYDGTFNIANEGVLYSASYNYAVNSDYLKNKDINNLGFYANYSLYDKKERNFNDTQRIILGTSFFYRKNIYTAFEWIIGKNDPYVGGGSYANGMAQGGNNHWENKISGNIGYYW